MKRLNHMTHPSMVHPGDGAWRGSNHFLHGCQCQLPWLGPAHLPWLETQGSLGGSN